MKSRTWKCWSFALAALLVAGTAFAQVRRTDPGVPPIPDLGSFPAWEVVPITGQAPASTLGALTMRTTDGALFVWSMHQERTLKTPATVVGGQPRRTDPADPAIPGEGGPGVPQITPTYTVSTLYQYSNGVWFPLLVVRDQIGAYVFAGPNGDLFANTNLPDGSVQVFHKYGAKWMVEPLPAGTVGPAGAFAGTSNVYMRTGNAILRYASFAWTVAYACDEFAIGGGLFDLGGDQVMAPCEGHEHILAGGRWFTNVEAYPTHVHSLWGGRDINGVLHLFAGGSDLTNTQARIFEYVETQPGTLVGQFQTCFQDAVGASGTSFINTVWGEGVHDVYATGVDHGVGQLYWFNGAGWVNAAPEMSLPATIGIYGTEESGLWMSLADGRLLHRPAVVAATEPTGPSPPPIADGGAMVQTRETMVVIGPPAALATLKFTLPESRNVSLSFFDLGGRRVDFVNAGRLAAGAHEVTWSANRVPSGVYFCRLEAGALCTTSKVLIQK